MQLRLEGRAMRDGLTLADPQAEERFLLTCLTELARRLRELGATAGEARQTVGDYPELFTEVVAVDVHQMRPLQLPQSIGMKIAALYGFHQLGGDVDIGHGSLLRTAGSYSSLGNLSRLSAKMMMPAGARLH
jgi:hypothetical protein